VVDGVLVLAFVGSLASQRDDAEQEQLAEHLRQLQGEHFALDHSESSVPLTPDSAECR